MPKNDLRPFRLPVPESVLEDLRRRLANTRFPDEPPLDPWSTGTSVAYLKQLLDYWAEGFDWRAQEAKLNAFRQFTVPLAGIDVHFIYEMGKGPDPMPLLLCHGWPGSVMEFYKLLPRLTDPARFGGDPADAFTVIGPSLPGYVFSFKPDQKRFGVEEIAEMLAALMTDVLGYPRFGAQGGDWGAFIASRLGVAFPERMHGPWPIPEGSTVNVPAGYAQFPKEILRPPRSVAERAYSDIRRWTAMPKGGHFAALEQPEALAKEIRAFFRPLR
jgi:pimeloyl-ACP methyl ester carboxylesterase